MGSSIIVYIIVGFIAQIIDGALGMAYGVTSTTFLLSMGIPPVAASASVHSAEVFTSGVSGLAHLRFGNVDKKLFKKLLIPGIIGGVLAAPLAAYVCKRLPSRALMIMVGLLIMALSIRTICSVLL
ncbi:hypothetical protein ES705_23225 [subsurface metagenome]